MSSMQPHTHTINATVPAVFTYDLESKDQDMRGLYEKAKRDQWNASRDIEWSQELNPDSGILPDGLIDIYGTKYWERLSPAQRTELNRHFSAWRISQLMYGEEFAMLVCSQLVNIVPNIDAKFFMSTQVVDEARHSEVLTRYLLEKVGVTYPLTFSLRNLFSRILELPQWYLKTVGTQLVAETLAVSLFRMLEQHSQDPLISSICKRILADESRHMGFGMLSLPDQVGELSEPERREVEDFACEAAAGLLGGQFPREAYETVGFNRTEIEDIQKMRHEVAQKNEYVFFRKFFKKDFHASLWNNLARVGLMSERAIARLGAMGIAAPQQSAAA
ncbi:MAG TPA: diiron oxygenase [Candidatus Binatia bacterium]|nr:diiron oxygenase [Candidatus Binatia bacterium]